MIVNGVFGWGGGVALLITFTDYLGYKMGIHGPVTNFDLVANFIGFPIAGIWFGYMCWGQLRGNL